MDVCAIRCMDDALLKGMVKTTDLKVTEVAKCSVLELSREV